MKENEILIGCDVGYLYKEYNFSIYYFETLKDNKWGDSLLCHVLIENEKGERYAHEMRITHHFMREVKDAKDVICDITLNISKEKGFK